MMGGLEVGTGLVLSGLICRQTHVTTAAVCSGLMLMPGPTATRLVIADGIELWYRWRARERMSGRAAIALGTQMSSQSCSISRGRSQKLRPSMDLLLLLRRGQLLW